jgi:hypothetical protein
MCRICPKKSQNLATKNFRICPKKKQDLTKKSIDRDSAMAKGVSIEIPPCPGLEPGSPRSQPIFGGRPSHYTPLDLAAGGELLSKRVLIVIGGPFCGSPLFKNARFKVPVCDELELELDEINGCPRSKRSISTAESLYMTLLECY